MPSLDSRIDDLYKEPLDLFTAARNALAKTLSGNDARLVKGLQKPTGVAWALNQLYWRARTAYDRALRAGEKLRAAQVAGLKGGAVDVRGAAEAHRRAIAAAGAEALRLAAAAGIQPDADELARTLDSLSVAAAPVAHPGRLTRVLQPAGFETLAGIAMPPRATAAPHPDASSGGVSTPTRADQAATILSRRRDRAQAAAERRRRATVEKAQVALDRAQAAEAQARERWQRTKRAVESAKDALTRIDTR